jgi:hypothetical protein
MDRNSHSLRGFFLFLFPRHCRFVTTFPAITNAMRRNYLGTKMYVIYIYIYIYMILNKFNYKRFTWEWFGIDPIANVREWDPPWWAEESDGSSGFPWFTFFFERIVIFGPFNSKLTKRSRFSTIYKELNCFQTATDFQTTKTSFNPTTTISNNQTRSDSFSCLREILEPLAKERLLRSFQLRSLVIRGSKPRW